MPLKNKRIKVEFHSLYLKDDKNKYKLKIIIKMTTIETINTNTGKKNVVIHLQ